MSIEVESIPHGYTCLWLAKLTLLEKGLTAEDLK